MSTLRFSQSYRTILKVSNLVGIYLETPEQESRSSLAKSICHYISIVVFLLWKCTCSSIANPTENIEDQVLAKSIAILQLSGILLVLYYVFWRKDITRLMKHIDLINDMIMRSSFGKEEFFKNTFLTSGRRLSRLHSIFSTNTVVCPFLYCSSHLVFNYLEGAYGETLPVPVECSFEKRIPLLYELFVFCQFLGLAFPALQKLGNEFILFGILETQSIFFQYLAESMKVIRQNFSKKSKTMKEVILWTRIHQETVKFIQETHATFSPIIILYYTTVISFTAAGLFYNLNAENASFVQKLTEGLYMVSTIFLFYILCHMTDNVNIQAERVAKEVYYIPWDEMNGEERQKLQTIICMANKPIDLMAYKAPSFTLNREAFLSFMVSIFSAYTGFSKIKGIE